METLDQFWALVRLARPASAEFDAALARMDQRELAALYQTYEDLVGDLKEDRFQTYWEGLSEDGIDSAAYHIVEQGEDYYRNVIEHPELVQKQLEVPNPGYDARGVIMKAYEKRFGEPIWEQLDREAGA